MAIPAYSCKNLILSTSKKTTRISPKDFGATRVVSLLFSNSQRY